jgi:hypothetical protein
LKIDVKIDIDAVVKLTELTLRQLGFAINNAITQTAKEMVEAGRKTVAADLTPRSTFIPKRVKILQYSKVGNLTAVVGIDDKVQGSPLILGFLEEGESGEKQPSAGPGIAIPLTGSPSRPSFPQKVPTGLRYKNLRLVDRQGAKRTYAVEDVGVFQRIASGDSPDSTILIYSFKPSAKLPTHMKLRAAMIDVADERFAANFNEQFIKEILRKAASL